VSKPDEHMGVEASGVPPVEGGDPAQPELGAEFPTAPETVLPEGADPELYTGPDSALQTEPYPDVHIEPSAGAHTEQDTGLGSTQSTELGSEQETEPRPEPEPRAEPDAELRPETDAALPVEPGPDPQRGPEGGSAAPDTETLEPAGSEVTAQANGQVNGQVPADADPDLVGPIEAILLVVDEPLPAVTLAQVLEQPLPVVEKALHALADSYTRERRGIDLREVAGGWRFYTREEYAEIVERFVLDGQQARLTQAALETLAVIAYRQPVSRGRVSAIRGVNCDGVVRTLLNRGLIEEAGTDDESGATLYRTTSYFLERLGLRSLDELPSLAPYLPEIDEIDAESGVAEPGSAPAGGAASAQQPESAADQTEAEHGSNHDDDQAHD